MKSAVPQRLTTRLRQQAILSAKPGSLDAAGGTFARGFTLAEMAVVLVIVALLIAGMLLPLSAQQDIRARQETEKTLNDIRDALLGFAVANGRLPRPAVSAADGAERAACATDADCSGFIPWAALGVKKIDGWGKLIRYSVTPAYANNTITLAMIANRTVQTRDKDGDAMDLAGNNSVSPPTDRCKTAVQCVPAVIFSQGKNNWGTTDAGVALPDASATNADEDANDAGPTNYFSRLASTDTAATGGEFDDMAIWLPTTILVNRLITAGKLP